MEAEVAMVAVKILTLQGGPYINKVNFQVLEATAVATTKEEAPVDMVEVQAAVATAAEVTAGAVVEVAVVAMAEATTAAAAATVARVCDS